MKIVLQKYIADSGHCSRRKAEGLIRSGKVYLNKKKAELGMRASDADEVSIGGKVLDKKKGDVYIILNKPEGYTCTNRKFRGEKNVFDLVKTSERLFVVGRLDRESQGLVLLTNDGDLAQEMTHPSFEHEKKYIVELEENKIDVKSVVNNFREGVEIGEGDGIVWAKNIKHLGKNKFEIVLIEGKKRQIRRMFNSQNLNVKKLSRLSIGKIKLGKLKKGESKIINKNQII